MSEKCGSLQTALGLSVLATLRQVSFKDLVIICRHWYRLYAPAGFTHRRNIDQIKTTDSLILALLI